MTMLFFSLAPMTNQYAVWVIVRARASTISRQARLRFRSITAASQVCRPPGSRWPRSCCLGYRSLAAILGAAFLAKLHDDRGVLPPSHRDREYR